MTTLRQLRFLTALDETKNFSRAAELSNVTQSTLSTALKELEARLGVQLAERSTHKVLMTRIGTEIAARARDVLARVGDIEALAAAEAGTGATLLRLGAIPTIGPFLMPRALPALHSALPGTRVYLREELTDALLAGLTEGRLDLVLIALPHDLPPGVETAPLFRDGYKLAAPRGHPLGNLSEIGPGDLAERRLLLLEPGHCLQRHALSSFPDAALGEDGEFSATSLPTLVSMVAEGLGVTLLPELAVDAGVARGHDIALSDLPGARPREVVLAWRRSSASAALYRKVGEVLSQARTELAG
ncbi:LysR family transcriptional regulator [Rhodobacterales bacterium HKCCE2091]|nr:LysR family transcriptional regulator [Rhodobacterales bacterium HKCCE2091]